MWAPSCDAGALLAAAELNASGGVIGQSVELVLADAGVTAAEAARAAAMLVEVEAVGAVVGMHPSNVRDAVKRQIGARAPYVYTPQYEGGERGRGVLAIGSTDEDVLRPTIPWFVEHKRARRFFLLGNDYVWPRTGSITANTVVGAAGGQVVGGTTIPFGSFDYSAPLAAIRRARPDVVITFLVGLEAITFHRAFAAAGLAPLMLRFSQAMDETVLYGVGAENAENLYAASNYIGDVHTREDDRFRELYHDSFGGAAPPTNVFARSCYDGVHLVAGLARLTGRRNPAAMALQLAQMGPFGAMQRLRPETEASPRAPVHLVAADGLGFRLIATH